MFGHVLICIVLLFSNQTIYPSEYCLPKRVYDYIPIDSLLRDETRMPRRLEILRSEVLISFNSFPLYLSYFCRPQSHDGRTGQL
jgi:hypothetical protein